LRKLFASSSKNLEAAPRPWIAFSQMLRSHLCRLSNEWDVCFDIAQLILSFKHEVMKISNAELEKTPA
jgi:hypothetical protein